ncbi:glycosyltransferase family protein [Flavobacterium subsaxonicum]|uniref:Glycosyltransferase subfamily 4-like N-terminal domain-containing protein n=1 Tax=Flavobacterium subsaxonicum WB 4.1-42 = DSM 21790 TaxID=1121898 RepID=A0A0A2MYR9_9FLAO|nr:glycosyltransferase [Flavobacterium subsaxonicum]KGO93365.1 hypothetical protein Q766_08670 [Flavobacterium subsaxonicum WB 4.1-42 = DSM 21790]
MKIVFLCGSLEPGKDGVGDYTLLLATELIRQGHAVKTIALNDRHVKTDVYSVWHDKETSVDVLRLPSLQTWNERMIKAKNFIDGFNSDVLSLQYVPFSFNDKGLPFNLSSKLNKLSHKGKWHIMFHELWGGINNSKTNTLKNRVFYFLQKKCVFHNLNAVKPFLITTSISAYQTHLKKYKVSILPLFSNIRFLNNHQVKQNTDIQAVNFGTFSGELDKFKNQLNWLKKVAEKQGKKIIFITFGSGGQFKLPSLNMAKNIFGNENVSDLGLLPAQEISNILSRSDIGISRADGLLWGKSGTTMAMLEHGLPVVLKGTRADLQLSVSDFNYQEHLYFCDDDYNNLPQRTHPVDALPKVAKQLYNLYTIKK